MMTKKVIRDRHISRSFPCGNRREGETFSNVQKLGRNMNYIRSNKKKLRNSLKVFHVLWIIWIAMCKLIVNFYARFSPSKEMIFLGITNEPLGAFNSIFVAWSLSTN